MNRRFLATVLACTATSSLWTANPPPAAATEKAETPQQSAQAKTLVHWEHTLPADLFARAKSEKRLVILDLEAIWCHWCHVMDENTYSNPAVADLIKKNFIALKIDQDSRPDLSNRYEDYGWPATIIFDSEGRELAKLSGYIPPDEMKALLQAFIKDPTPGPSATARPTIKYSDASSLPQALRDDLIDRHLTGFDEKYGSWGTFQKFLDWDSVEFSLARAREGSTVAATRASEMAKKTLTAQLNLIDPVWGGVYQYSTGGNWEHPHFERIMQFQGENLKVFAQGYAQFKDPAYLKAAEDIYKFLTTFMLSPEGAFYTSMDADIVQGQHSDWYYKLSDAERRKHGIPRIDKHIYSRENGWAINGIVALYQATGDKKYLDTAVKAADWIEKNRSLAGGGLSHGETRDVVPYLGDTLFMGRAFLSLYAATGDRKWLNRAEAAANFIAKHFAVAKTPGFITAESSGAGLSQPDPLLDENVTVARFANLLYQYTGKSEYKDMSTSAMKYLATPEIANKRRAMVAGILMADKELASDPVHITVVGRKDDSAAQALFLEALKYPNVYKRTEWWDSREGALPRTDIELPQLPEAAAFTCGDGRCSRPAKQPQDLALLLQKLNGQAEQQGTSAPPAHP